nr:MAG TPA: hypothetical protein [Caudoviricetes sp.]
MTAYNNALNTMRDTMKKPGYGRYILLVFCLAFTITGVWFPAYFMWVVWAFIAYLALNIILVLALVICMAVIVLILRSIAKRED